MSTHGTHSFFVHILVRGGMAMRRRGCAGAMGACALALGIGILAAAILPTGALLWLAALGLIGSGIVCLRR